MGIEVVTTRAPTHGGTHNGNMDRATTDHYDTPLARRFRAAGIPVPPPLTEEQRADLDRRIAEAAAQPRIYGPKTTAA